ncbi:MAG: class I SAM-dependent methyltransferase [Agathobacter sp.]|nr:class I SAM-dependent methyltransferase [Agathobacter sp.]
MEAYTSFAQVYDLFMDNVPYEMWCDFLEQELKQNGISDGIIVDLGCGTGKMTRMMSKKGYDMIGIDNSFEMLDIAREFDTPKEMDEKSILYLLQDMREFELYGTVRAIYSACDSLNYILEEEDLLAVFQLANNYLDPNGYFIFDMNTPYKYHTLLADNTFAENREEGSFIWENYFDEEEQINEYDLTLFVENEQGSFTRFQEVHYQKCYEIETIKKLIKQSGLELVGVYDAYTKEALREDSEKVMFITREFGK